MPNDTCLGCGKPFPANKELASVPLARLVAFDPDHDRVWQVCEPCGHWNLLGPETARAATPELVSRYEASVAAGGTGLTMAIVSGKLLLLRIGAAPTSAGAELVAQEVHTAIGKGLTWRQGVAVLAFIGIPAVALFLFEQIPILSAVLDSDARKIALPAWLGTHFWRSSEQLLRGRHRWARWVPLLFVPVVTLEVVQGESPLWIRLAALAIAVGIGIRTGKIEGAPRGISWDNGSDNPRYHDGHHPEVHGWAAITMLLVELDREFTGKVTPEERAEAWAIWQRDGSLRGMLAGLGERRDTDGRLALTALTKPERMAMLIAVGARMAEPPADVLAGLAEAERVAAIAEQLDRQLAEPA